MGQVLVVALFAVAFYYAGAKRMGGQASAETPPGRMTVAQEQALGRQATPLMIQQHGGLAAGRQAQAWVQRVGERLVVRSGAGQTPYTFSFHLLADAHALNVFALPGGAVFVTAALAARLRTEGELAALLAHAIAHITERHAAARVEAAATALPSAEALTAFDPDAPVDAERAQIAHLIIQAVTLPYEPDAEVQADARAVGLLAEAGYDPRALLGALTVLRDADRDARTPFFETHPNPFRRREHIQRAIEARFPGGVPEGLVE